MIENERQRQLDATEDVARAAYQAQLVEDYSGDIQPPVPGMAYDFKQDAKWFARRVIRAW